VVSTSQSLPISGTDTCSYTCRCSYKEQPTCYFNLTAYTIPRLPEASFTYSLSYSDCETHITFNNNSFVYILQGGVKDTLPNEHLTSQTWLVRSANGFSYNNRTSTAKNLPTIDVPKQGDVVTITLTGFANGCDDDTTIVINVPPLKESHGVTNRYVCIGTPVIFNQERYTFLSADTIEIVDAQGNKRYITGRDSVQVIDTLSSWCGCDSVLELNLRAMVPTIVDIDTTICSDQTFCIRVYDVHQKLVLDTCPHATGYYEFPIKSSLGSCDTLLYRLNLTVLDVLEVGLAIQSSEICADAEHFTGTCTLSYGGLAGYKIEYLGDAKNPEVGFQDTPDTVPFLDGDSGYIVYFDLPVHSTPWNAATGAGTYARPGTYQAKVTLYNQNKECGHVVVTRDFTVLYPKDVIAQRWNDFLGIRNDSHNGGYKFAHYVWYINGQPVESHVNTVSQYYKQGQLLDFTAQYQVALTRENENYPVMTCAFTPIQYDNAVIQNSTIVIASSTKKNDVQVKTNAPARGHLYNISGVLIGEYDFYEGENSFTAPEVPGIYVMMFVYEDGTTETVKFTIE